MAHNLTLDIIVPAAAISVPEDGDDLDAAVMEVALQNLGDRTESLIAAVYSRISWAETLAVADGGTLTSFSIAVGAVHRLFSLTATGTMRVGTAGAATITQADIEGGGGTLGALARWWYVYAWMDGGTLAYAISLTAPDASRRVKGGDASRAYLGCFRTTATGAPLPTQKVGGLCLYRASALGSGELQVVSVSVATGATTQSLAALVPPHARLARLALAVTGDSNQAALNIFYPGDTAAKSATCYAAASSADNEVHADVPTDSSQQVDYSVTGTGSPAASVRVLGFYE